jgi:putrescine aminotransferase
MSKSHEDAMAFAQRWIDIIHKTEVTEDEAKAIIEESKYNFAEHFNRGWLDCRKSVTEAGDWACVEWTGTGAIQGYIG